MARWVTVAGLFVVFVLVGTGPLTGLDVTSAPADTFGDGDAVIADVSVDRSGLALTTGRFGTSVTYLRAPPATVTVDSVTDRPRLLYIVTVPALDVRLVETRVLTGPGTYRLAPDDGALAPGTADGSYGATLSVRLQSFTTDRQLRRTNVTVEAPR